MPVLNYKIKDKSKSAKEADALSSESKKFDDSYTKDHESHDLKSKNLIDYIK